VTAAAPSRAAAWGALAIALVAAAVTWRMVPRTFFYADDFLNLYELSNLPASTFVFRTHAGHALVVRNLVFWATLAGFGPNSSAFFGTVLAGHLVAVALLFAVALRATRSAVAACFIAVSWGTCPTNAGTLSWYSVFGQVLASIFVLAALWLLLDPRARADGPTPRRLGACGVLLLLSASCFGVGLPVIAVTPVLVWLLAPAGGPSRRAWAVALAIPVVAAVLYLAQTALGEPGGPLSPRGPGIGSVFDALPFAARTFAELLGYGIAALLRGPSSGVIPWPTTVSLAVGGGAAVVVAAALATAERSTRRLVLALLLVAFATYGAIVAARTPLYVLLQWTPTAVGQTPRYHYLAQAALALALGVSLHALLWRLPGRAGVAVLALATALVVVGSTRRVTPYALHQRDRLSVRMFMENLRRTAVATPPGETVRVRNRIFPNVSPLISYDQESFPGMAALFVIFAPRNAIAGRPIVFEAQNERVLGARARGGRIASLLVPPADGVYPTMPAPAAAPRPAP